ncbi:MAG: DNA mismatch repair protein MutL, partial [Clostridiaceae bacterium]|nr:DNA mismatch repair protein MutL [Clostridiaceae bacterium]
VGCPKGTTFIIKNLFYNTPARYKFLKKDSTEAGYVSDIIERLSLARPDISFKFIQNGQVRLHTPGNNDLLSVIYSIYGNDVASKVLPVEYQSGGFTVAGFAGRPEISRGNRNRQSIFLNGRYIKSRIVSLAAEEAYKTMVMQNKFPFYVLLLEAPQESFDVNVHPQKLEVRFSDEKEVYSVIYHGVKNSLLQASLIRHYDNLQAGDKNDQHKVATNIPLKELYSPEVLKNREIQVSDKETQKPHASSDKSYDLSEESHNLSDKTQGLSKKSQDFTNKDDLSPHNLTEILFDGSTRFNNVREDREDTNDAENVASVTHDIIAASREAAQEIILDFYYPTGETRDPSLLQLKEAQIVGQVFNTYILLQNGSTLYIIDQHAAHERIRYEILKQRLEKSQSYSQSILEPIIIQLSADEFDFVMENQEIFQKFGFDLEAFGTNTVIIRSIPDIYDSSFGVSDFNEILDRWVKTHSEGSIISDEVIYTMSCKGALKANKVLSNEEIKELINSLCNMENPWTCLHGRPVIIKIDRKDFEKKFKRIV